MSWLITYSIITAILASPIINPSEFYDWQSRLQYVVLIATWPLLLMLLLSIIALIIAGIFGSIMAVSLLRAFDWHTASQKEILNEASERSDGRID